jgi:CIC family chloride channel protein
MSISAEPAVVDRLADFTRDKRILLLSLFAVIIGLLSTISAWCLVNLIALISNLVFYQTVSTKLISLAHHHLGAWVILIPAIGGLIIGLMARYGSEKIRGHGIPEALEAILFGQSKMSVRVAILKPLSSAISIGTGGPFGAEGPIIMTGGALGSLFAQLFHLSAIERKTLLVAGAAGGMAAIFATPVAAVLLAVELLLFEWKPRSFIPVTIGAVVAGVARISVFGQGPIFPVPPHPLVDGNIMLFALLVGLLSGFVSGVVTQCVYFFEHAFEKLPVHWMWWPAIGGLFVGIGGFFDPRVLGVGYDLIQSLLSGQLLGWLVVGLLFGKSLVWACALGSGTSGGVLAPLLIIGGALGAVLAQWIPVGDAGLWAMIGMAAMMGGTMRAPLTAMIFAIELTHDINLLPALLIGCVAAYTLTIFLMPRSILTEKVTRRGYHINCEYGVDPLSITRVQDVMETDLQIVPDAMSLLEFSQLLAKGTRHQASLIINQAGDLVGLITRGDVIRAMEANADMAASVLSCSNAKLTVTYPDELLKEAVKKMVTQDIGRLPVVDRLQPTRLVGYIGRSAIIQAQVKQLKDESFRESRWFSTS